MPSLPVPGRRADLTARADAAAKEAAAHRPLREELAAGVRTVGFRNAVVRQFVILTGVFILGWAPLEIAFFFLLEVFLFLSLRAAAEITVESGLGRTSAAAFAWELVKHWLAAALIIGFLVGILGAFVVLPFASEESRSAFDAMSDPSFLVGITLLTGSLVFDTALFARRVAAGRSPEEAARDVLSVRAALANVVLLVMASVWFGIFSVVGLGAKGLVIAMAVIRLYVEAAPRRATKVFRP
jgi:hypothetical protein